MSDLEDTISEILGLTQRPTEINGELVPGTPMQMTQEGLREFAPNKKRLVGIVCAQKGDMVYMAIRNKARWFPLSWWVLETTA